MPVLWLIGLGVVTAYVVAMVGPKPPPSTLTDAQLAQLQASNAEAARQAASQAASQALQQGQLFEPGFQGQPGASVSGALFWRGELAPDGAKIVYDVRGNPHHVYGA